MGRRILIVIAILLIGTTVVLCGWFLLRFGVNRFVGPVLKPTPSPALTTAEKSTCEGSNQTSVLKRIISRKAIVMGVQEDAPPMNYLEADEEDETKTTRKGFDYELASLIAAQLSLVGPETVKVKEVDLYEKLFCLLKQKDGDEPVDIIMSGIARDDEMADIEWSEAYYDFGYALIAKKTSGIKNLNDCKSNKSRVGVVKGDSAVEAYVKSKLPKAEIVPIEDDDNWINAINLGTVDVVIYDFPFAVTEVQLLNEEKKKGDVPDDYLEIKKPYLPDSGSQYCIGIPGGNPDLKAKLDAVISRLKGSPKYIELVKKYFQSNDIKLPDKPAEGADTYRVQRGDSLSAIALNELGDADRWTELADLNNIGNEYLIFPNQQLTMPPDYKH